MLLPILGKNTYAYKTFQVRSTLDSVTKEKNQLEAEMREIYDKRESVAQWEAQISEIIKWWVMHLPLKNSLQSQHTDSPIMSLFKKPVVFCRIIDYNLQGFHCILG